MVNINQYFKRYVQTLEQLWNNPCDCDNEHVIVEGFVRPQPDINFDTQNELFNTGSYNTYYRNLYNLEN